LLALELVLRALNPLGVVPAPPDRELSYRGVAAELASYGAPEVAVVGSSRARRAVMAPLLRQFLKKQGNRVRVGNFALGGAMAEEIEVAVRRLTEASPPPSLIVWPIASREFEGRPLRPVSQVRYLWRPRDWWRARTELGSSADPLLPDAVRNEAARHSLLVRYRFTIRDLVAEPPRRNLVPTLANTFMGRRGPTTLHGDVDPKFLRPDADRSHNVSSRRVKAYIGNAYTEPDWPRNYQAQHLERALFDLKRAGIPIVFFELPSHPLLEELMPAGTSHKFREHMRGVASRHRVPFVSLEELSVAFEKADFREQSHLNRGGAEKYTSAIAPWVARSLRAPSR
jgi:hypothetical protein